MKTTLHITATGINLHHLVAYFEVNHIAVASLSRVDAKTLTFTLSKADFGKLKKEPIFKNYAFSVTKVTGAASVFKTLLGRAGLIVGALALALFFVNISSRVMSVEFCSSGHVCQNGEYCIFCGDNLKNLEDVLAENGIFKGAKISSLPQNRDIERVVVQAFPQVSALNITRVGTTLKVSILEAKLPQSMLAGDLVAPESGVVLSMDVASGKALVKNGDIVLKNQPLVKAENSIPVSATVVLRVFFHDNTIYSENQIEYVRTGRQTTTHQLQLFNLKTNPPTSSFALYETQTTSRYVFYNLFVPLKSKQTTFFELEAVETTIPFEEEEERVKNALYEKVKTLLLPSCKEKATTFATYKEGSRVRVDCYVEAYMTVKK